MGVQYVAALRVRVGRHEHAAICFFCCVGSVEDTYPCTPTWGVPRRPLHAATAQAHTDALGRCALWLAGER
eukprot:7390232-Prymnesium_polylepis.1